MAERYARTRRRRGALKDGGEIVFVPAGLVSMRKCPTTQPGVAEANLGAGRCLARTMLGIVEVSAGTLASRSRRRAPFADLPVGA